IVHGDRLQPEYVMELYQGLVDGVIVADGESLLSVGQIKTLLDRNVPMIAHSLAHMAEIPSIDPNIEDGVRQLLVHLARLGHRNIGFIGSPQPAGRKDERLVAFTSLLSQF